MTDLIERLERLGHWATQSDFDECITALREKDRRIEELEWDYGAACATLETRDREIEELEKEIESMHEDAAGASI